MCDRETDKQISQKRSISADEIYSTIRAEWTDDYFGLGLT